jgi:phosphoribosylformylglycinamidine cyclo-ligase
VPRILPGNVDLAIEDGSWPVLPVFSLLRKIGNVPLEEMRRTFNLGVGMVIIAAREHAALVEEGLTQAGEAHYRIGEVVDGTGKVRWV